MATYACSDLHGMYDLYRQIKEYVKPEDTIYVLGDCGDRGPEGWRLIKTVYFDKQCIYLRGNHEELLAEAMNGFPQLLYQNGGENTYRQWWEDEQARTDWDKALMELPTYAFYERKDGKRVFLSHSGCDPEWTEELEEAELLWNRQHIKTPTWNNKYDDLYIVHGHTPMQNIKGANFENIYDIKGAYCYCDGRKYDIDCGSFASYKTILLDLDTFESKVFETNLN